ncbi:hypothetical protein EBT16_06830 [bacterium]|nr:hypothetical protein [bacterium]
MDAQTQKKISRAELMGIGFEVATLGVRNSSSNDLLGLQLLYGLRAVFIYPLSPKFFLKPSVGYFLKPEREGEVSVTQNVMEAGLGIHYALLTRKSFLWHVGLSQRADYLFSKISIKDSSANTPGLFRYRAGAASGLRFKLGSRADLTFDLEVGAIPFDNFRLQSAFSSGIIFFID